MITNLRNNFSSIFRKCLIPLYWAFSLILWEVLAHKAMYPDFTPKFWYAVLLDVAAASVLTAIAQLLPRILQGIFTALVSLLMIILYGSQMVYCTIFGTPYSVRQMGQGGQALSYFFRETLSAMGDIWLYLAAMFLPIIVLGILFRRRQLNRAGWKWSAAALILSCIALSSFQMALPRGGTGMYSDYYFFTSPKSTTTQTMERFGMLPTFYLEYTRPEPEEDLDTMIAAVIQPTEPETVDEEPAAEEKPPVYHVYPLDFEGLNTMTEDKKIQSINNYISQLPGTAENEYTGMLKDYNLILLCCESFSPAAIDKDLTPTLYRMREEGIHFNNFYNSYPNTTIDGEYALLQGLFPDDGKSKYSSSMLASSRNVLPFTLGNIFSQQRDIPCFGFHNNTGKYYDRKTSHPNLGYKMYFAGAGMHFSSNWPASDLEMIEQSLDYYINEPQFHAYYMTFSGHYRYTPDTNNIAVKNWDAVKNIEGWDEAQKAYLACNIELDKAMEYLLEKLEEAGIADKTAVVLAGDHFPYGLSDKQYSGIVGHPVDSFSKYKSDLIFWVGGLEEPISTDAYCCNVDILPTLLNLWGLDYDSRMLSGTDIFSNGLHVAILKDRSFLTDVAWFNSNNAEVTWQTEDGTAPDGYIETMNQYVDQKVSIAASILRTNYFKFITENKDAFTVESETE